MSAGYHDTFFSSDSEALSRYIPFSHDAPVVVVPGGVVKHVAPQVEYVPRHFSAVKAVRVQETVQFRVEAAGAHLGKKNSHVACEVWVAYYVKVKFVLGYVAVVAFAYNYNVVRLEQREHIFLGR